MTLLFLQALCFCWFAMSWYPCSGVGCPQLGPDCTSGIAEALGSSVCTDVPGVGDGATPAFIKVKFGGIVNNHDTWDGEAQCDHCDDYNGSYFCPQPFSISSFTTCQWDDLVWTWNLFGNHCPFTWGFARYFSFGLGTFDRGPVFPFEMSPPSPYSEWRNVAVGLIVFGLYSSLRFYTEPYEDEAGEFATIDCMEWVDEDIPLRVDNMTYGGSTNHPASQCDGSAATMQITSIV